MITTRVGILAIAMFATFAASLIFFGILLKDNPISDDREHIFVTEVIINYLAKHKKITEVRV